MVLATISQRYQIYSDRVQQHRLSLSLIVLVLVGLWIYLNPQKFIDLWLTRDQQGQLLFQLGNYQQAAQQFNDPQWQAFSFYAAEEFDQAATLYGQSGDIASMLARGNALAQGRRYIKARDTYQWVLTREPGNEAAQHNIAIVQEIIDEVNRMSESQVAEGGDPSKELGDKAQTGDGAEKQVGKQRELKQLSAEQLLLDPSLNELWLRQVQKNPKVFLSNKFYRQNAQGSVDSQTESDGSSVLNVQGGGADD